MSSGSVTLKHFIDERADVEVNTRRGDWSVWFGTGHLYKCLRRLAVVAPETESSSSSLSPLTALTSRQV